MRFLLASLIGLCAGPALAEPAPIAVTGHVGHPGTLSAGALAALPQADVEISFEAGHEEKGLHFSGPLLWAVVSDAAPADEPGQHTKLLHTIIAHGQDGYSVVLALGEIDPRLEGKQAIIATAQDGKPLASYRLIVPGDKHASRAVRDLVGIEIK